MYFPLFDGVCTRVFMCYDMLSFNMDGLNELQEPTHVIYCIFVISGSLPINRLLCISELSIQLIFQLRKSVSSMDIVFPFLIHSNSADKFRFFIHKYISLGVFCPDLVLSEQIFGKLSFKTFLANEYANLPRSNSVTTQMHRHVYYVVVNALTLFTSLKRRTFLHEKIKNKKIKMKNRCDKNMNGVEKKRKLFFKRINLLNTKRTFFGY